MDQKSPKVLIVDDDQDIRNGFGLVLKKGGYEVNSASDISEAEEQIQLKVPDIIYIDRILGDEDGIDLLNKLQKDQELKHVFKVLISGKVTSGGDITEGLEKGADGYLKKPVSNRELLAQTNNFLRQRSDLIRIYDSEQRLSKIINSNPDAIIILSKDGTIRFANPAAERLIKKQGESLVGHEFGMPAVAENSTEVVVRSDKGYAVIASMNFVEEEWEGEDVYIATLRDITEKKRAEERAAHLNSLLEAISKINQLIVHEQDKATVFNKAAELLQKTHNYSGVAIALFDDDKQKYRVYANSGMHYFPLDWEADINGEGNVPACMKDLLKKRKAIICNNESHCRDCQYNRSLEENQMVVSMVMSIENKLSGILTITFFKTNILSEEEKGHLRSISGDLAFAYEKFRMSRTLQKKEKQYQQLFERSPVGVFQTTSDGEVVTINTEMARILEFDSVEDALSRYDDLRTQLYANPARRDEFIALLKKQGKVQGFVYEAVTAKNNKKWIIMNATVGEKQSDDKFLIEGFATDITKDRKNQQQLKLSEQKYRNLFNSIRDAVLVADTERKIIDCNEKFTELFGYEINEIEGKFTQAVYGNQEDYRDMGNVLANYDGGDYVYKTIIYKKKNGETFPGETHVFSVTDNDGVPSAYVGLIRDISQRVKTYESLAESEQRFRNLYNSSAVGITILSKKMNLDYANKAFCNFLLYSEEELQGFNIADLCYESKDMIKHTEALISDEKPYFESEVQFIRKDGEKVWGMIHVSPVKDSTGNTRYFLADIVDVDKLKKTENELLEQIEEYQALNEEYQSQNEEYEVQNEELNATLQRIRQMNEELQVAKSKAEENDRLKSAFLANMSHEIRTPMNAIIGFSDLLLAEELSMEEQNKYLKVIMKKGASLLRLIDMIIDTAKIEGKQLNLVPERFEVNTLIDEVYETNKVILEKEKEKSRIALKMNKAFPDNNIFHEMDTGRLRQIFNNLINNAIKYTNEGTIEVGYTADNESITFFVSDSGVGIAAEEQPYVFERFRRGENQLDLTTRKLIGGTGLGLSIVKDLTELMGGKIKLQSETGKGTTFFVRFPLRKQTSKKPKPEKKMKTHDLELKGKKILLVEDEPDNMEYLHALMSKTGAVIHKANDGHEAIEKYQKDQSISIVLMDIKLPGMDGYEVTRQLKAINPGLIIIAQTAYAMPEDAHRSRDAGCDGYISKPINKADLYAVIRRAMSKYS